MRRQGIANDHKLAGISIEHAFPQVVHLPGIDGQKGQVCGAQLTSPVQPDPAQQHSANCPASVPMAIAGQSVDNRRRVGNVRVQQTMDHAIRSRSQRSQPRSC